jgi:hypothetical protein
VLSSVEIEIALVPLVEQVLELSAAPLRTPSGVEPFRDFFFFISCDPF